MRFGMSISIMSPSRNAASGPPTAASGAMCAIIKPCCGAGEAPVGHQRDVIAEATSLYRRRHGQHFAHPRTALRPLVANDHHVTFPNIAGQHGLEARFLAVEYPCRSAEGAVGGPARLGDRAVGGDVAAQDGQACRSR